LEHMAHSAPAAAVRGRTADGGEAVAGGDPWLLLERLENTANKAAEE
jgi:hypothetical protein